MKSGVARQVVEFVDLYPTLCELCGLDGPQGQLDGTSFVPLLRNPRKGTKEHVYIQWEGGDNAVDVRYNYAEWGRRKEGKRVVTDRMLFDHRLDPEENRNRAEDKRYRKVMDRLSQFLEKVRPVQDR